MDETETARENGAQQQHTNEVSLPGAGTSQSEQPTILQVLNDINARPENSQATPPPPEVQQDPIPVESNSHAPRDSLTARNTADGLRRTSSERSRDSSAEGVSELRRQQLNQDNVLDIESHLIETYDDYQAKEDSVRINELAPIQDELTKGSSKIETDANVRTVIEVEPAGAKTTKLIETSVHSDRPHQTAEVINTTAESQAFLDLKEDITRTAQNLVHEIEQQVLESLNNPVEVTKIEKELPRNGTAPHEGTDALPELKQLNKAFEQENDQQKNDQQKNDQQKSDQQQNEQQKNEQQQNEQQKNDQQKNDQQKNEQQQNEQQKNDQQKNDQQKNDQQKNQQQESEQQSEVTSILKSSKHTHLSPNFSTKKGEKLSVVNKLSKELKIVDVPSPKTALEVEERKLFIESLPQIESNTDANKLAVDCKREYYQSLKKYLVQNITDRPPVPLQTYRWEDLKRAKERGGYPWTHLYKRPLGPDEEPEILLLLRKSQELRFTSESPKSLKKVRIDEQVLVKEAERYIQELSEEEEEQHPSASTDEENHSLRSESISCVSDSVLAAGKPRKSNRLAKIRGILKRRRTGQSDDAKSLPDTLTNTDHYQSEEVVGPPSPQLLVNGKNPNQKTVHCYPIMKKLKSMADRQKKRLNIKHITLKKDEKIVFGEETKILKLKNSPKSERGEIPHFIEKQDSDDVLEIVQLDESPSRKRRDDDMDIENDIAMEAAVIENTLVQPDEIIEILNDLQTSNKDAQEASTDTVECPASETTASTPPKKAPRLRREHVYEEIEPGDIAVSPLGDILEIGSVETLKQSLAKQDHSALTEIEAAAKPIPLDRMGSSEEEQIAAAANVPGDGATGKNLLAPIYSIESTSSDDDRKPQLSPVSEESDVGSTDGHLGERETHTLKVSEDQETELKPAIKKEASPAPSDKKVTFSHVEDEAEPHREDIELPEGVMPANNANNKWKNMSDHEYEPIGVSSSIEEAVSVVKERSPVPNQYRNEEATPIPMEIDTLVDQMKEAEDLQKDLEERYFSSETTTPRTESRTDYEIHTSQVDSSALEELPLKPESRKKGFMATAQDRTRKMQAGFKNQAGKIKTKLRVSAKKPPSGSPKAKERKRFKAPEFSKIKMPDIKRPDMSKLKDFKRPEFTKFNKPDMSKFKLSEKFSTLKLRRSKSFKENEIVHDEETSGVTPESGTTTDTQHPKKMFEFNFGTYPRAFRKKKKPLEQQSVFHTDTPLTSVIQSTETQPSIESSSSPQGDRGPGPVRSRWADKFSDVSYNDSEGSRYRRYGSEQESFDRESSLERRMKDDLEDTGSEAQDLGILGGVADNREFAEFDEENRAIHEISNLRAGEFKRRPIVHQDSDLRSEDSKEAEGWTDKEVQKNKLLRKAEIEAEASYLKYPYEEEIAQETHSTASSGKKVVMEEINDDEFFLRKRGISEDNIELRQYISNAIREGYDMPLNTLQHVGQPITSMEYDDYDIPPPKPRRLHKGYRPEDVSQDLESQRSDYGDDLSISQNGSDFFGAPRRPMRKGRSRSKYSMDSQDVPIVDEHITHEQYFHDDEDYLRPPGTTYKEHAIGMNNLDYTDKSLFSGGQDEEDDEAPRPQPRIRRKRQLRESSMDKDPYIKGFNGRSVSNSYLQPPEDVIVYRTEHEYHIPLATPENYTDGASAESRKSRSASRFDEDDRTSRGADSLALDANLRSEYDADMGDVQEFQEKFIIDMMENDGYAVVRKEHIPKPTPPARRKKFSRSPGERFATTSNMGMTRSTPPPERPPPPRSYSPIEDQPVPPRRKSALGSEAPQNYDEDDYEEPETLDHERPESPRNLQLQSGEIINKMKYRPLPPPPRPPREKRQRGSAHELRTDSEDNFDDRDGGGERIASSSTADSYDQSDDFGEHTPLAEVEVSTQTDPLPDDFICEEFEITEDMKIIEPRRLKKTLDELLIEEPVTEDDRLTRGLQRFRDANQRSVSERSRASSQADRSKSLSRPQTPSAIVIERRVATPVPSQHSETMLEASLTVQPIDDLQLEEEALRREGLLTDSSQQSKSDVDSRYQGKEEGSKSALSDTSYISSSVEFEATLQELLAQNKITSHIESGDEEVERTMRDYEYDDQQAERYSTHDEEDENVAKEDDEFRLKREDTEDYGSSVEEHIIGRDASMKQVYEEKESEIAAQLRPTDLEKSEDDTLFEEPPHPPPRRKSTTTIEPSSPTLTVVEQQIIPKEVVPVQTEQVSHLPCRLEDLEVERLRVHALQAGQIMVSQLHGTQISSDELDCKSGNLVVKNIELPPGFIEDIVERVRSTDRSAMLTTETQTSLQTSVEMLPTEQTSAPVHDLIPPPKPPRHRDLESDVARTSTSSTEQPAKLTLERLRNLDEETQTDPTETPSTNLAATPPIYPTVEYLQSLAPLAFYNLQKARDKEDEDSTHRHHQHHHHHRKRVSSSSEEEDEQTDTLVKHPRSRSGTRSPHETKSVTQAGRQFISACSLSLANIINQLTTYIRGDVDKDQDIGAQTRQVPTLVVLFIVITFGLLVFLLSGRNVHTHHWDFFNPPGNHGRQS